jgi:hypothetical protein
MNREARVLAVLAVLIASLLGVAAAPASAHPRVATGPEAMAPAAPLVAPVASPVLDAGALGRSTRDPSVLGPVVALVLALVTVRLVRRRGLIAALALTVGVLAAETGVHSVHHLDDAQAAADCVVAVVTAQVQGTLDEPPAIDDTRPAEPVGSVPAPPSERPGPRPYRPDEGRAPPAA